MAGDNPRDPPRARKRNRGKPHKDVADAKPANSHTRTTSQSKRHRNAINTSTLNLNPTVRDESVTSSRDSAEPTTHIPQDLVYEKLLDRMDYHYHKDSTGYRLDGVLSTEQLRDLLTQSHELQQRSAKESSLESEDSLAEAIRDYNSVFEDELREICRLQNVPEEVFFSIIAEHGVSQRRKAKNRRHVEVSKPEAFDLIAQLARIKITGHRLAHVSDESTHNSDTDSDQSTHKHEHEHEDTQNDRQDHHHQPISPVPTAPSPNGTSASEEDDASTIDMGRPSQARVRDRRTRMTVAVVNDSTDKEDVITPKTKILGRRRRSTPPHVPFVTPGESQAENKALAIMQRDDTSRQRDVIMLKTLEILQDGLWFARDQRESSSQVTHAQVLKDLKDQEALLNARTNQRLEEVKRIRQEILESEKERQEELLRIREQVRREVEAEYYLVHKTESTT